MKIVCALLKEYSSPGSATSGLAGYDLERGARLLMPLPGGPGIKVRRIPRKFRVKTKPASKLETFVREKFGGHAADAIARMGKYSDDQPRDDNGRWSGGGDASSKAGTDEHGFTRSGGLSSSDRAAEQRFYDRIRNDPEGVISEYRGMFGSVIDPDQAKMLSPDFRANKGLAAAVHEPSSTVSKMVFARELADNKAAGNERPVVFTAGGGGSGKTEAMELAKNVAGIGGNPIVFDSTLSSSKSAVSKIDQALASGAKVNILYTNRPVGEAFKFAAGRSRVVPIEVLAHAHVGAADTVRTLAEHYAGNPNVTIGVVNNYDGVKGMTIGKVSDVPHYSYEHVVKDLNITADTLHAAGAIDDQKYANLKRSVGKSAGSIQGEQLRKDVAGTGRRQGEGNGSEGGRLPGDPRPEAFRFARALIRLVKRTSQDGLAHQAATSPFNLKPHPTENRAKAGNYPKGHVKIAGLDISIENPAGSRRRPEWPVLQAHYGYIRRTEGADGDQMDVFVRVGTPDDYSGPVYVIDQHVGGWFDEHKVMLGWYSDGEARQAYLRNFTPDWTGLHAITMMSIPDFKRWLSRGDTTKPIVKRARLRAISMRV